ncbi:MAG TPA: hypothetical protein PLA25_12375 [Anaerolineaceae bacterium]|nr:hypothetical protein [Anaerolineaceae bacterium]
MKGLLTSRAFWAALIGLVLVCVTAFVPSFDLDTETAVGFGVIIASYILGVTIDPGPGGWRGVLLSRKFWSAFVGMVFLVLDGFGILFPFEMTADQVVLVILSVTALIAGPAVEPLLLARAAPKKMKQ